MGGGDDDVPACMFTVVEFGDDCAGAPSPTVCDADGGVIEGGIAFEGWGKGDCATPSPAVASKSRAATGSDVTRNVNAIQDRTNNRAIIGWSP